ncbi:MAG: linear amide C-N hydrolase, partial [Myxococcota bacterium]
MKKTTLVPVAALFLFALLPFPADACTVFRLKADDGSVVVARSMEFAVDLKYELIVVPRNKSYTSPAPDGSAGLSWKTGYGYAGVATADMDYGITDGMNEKGLAIGLLWFESDMKYQDVAPGENARALAQAMVGDWVLGNFAAVEDVKREIQKLKVFKYTDPATKMAPTLHFIVYDANGGSIVIEYENGVCNVYDNPLGIMTNAPRFPWQVTNLRQYVGMRSDMPEPVKVSGLTLTPTGHGAGMLGLPGDLTPPSRFVRLAVLTRFADAQP